MNQQDFEASQLKRRATDFGIPSCPCGQDMMNLLQKMEGDIREIKHGMGTFRTAFIRNDLGEPDYEGHRQAHLGMVKKSESIDRMKDAGTLKVVGIVVTIIVGIFMSGLGVHIQKFFGG